MARSKSWIYTVSTIEKDILEKWTCEACRRSGIHLGTDVVIMDTSWGQKNEKLVHTKDDTLKNIHGFICALEPSFLWRYSLQREILDIISMNNMDTIHDACLNLRILTVIHTYPYRHLSANIRPMPNCCTKSLWKKVNVMVFYVDNTLIIFTYNLLRWIILLFFPYEGALCTYKWILQKAKGWNIIDSRSI